MSIAEIASLALPGLPNTARGMLAYATRSGWMAAELKGTSWRPRIGRGGGFEIRKSTLPLDAQVTLAAAAEVTEETEKLRADRQRADLWDWFSRLPASKKAVAEGRIQILQEVQLLLDGGMRKVVATEQVAVRHGIAVSSIYRWQQVVLGADRGDWLPLLVSKHHGSRASADIPEEALAALKADFLRPSRPNFSDCFRRLEALAAEKGWALPSEATLRRRIEALPESVRLLAREGTDAAKRLYPSQIRDRSVFHALQAVNADGHKWDVFVRWPDGSIGRPVMVAFQDLYSGRMLSWRIDRSENREAVRLAFGDVIERYGIPELCYFDNGRNFASKWLTGGVPNRFRFKVRDEEPLGILTQLGVAVHWTTPYSGQSKPIERAFRDLAQGVARHPAFEGAWCGNTPLAKPENYGSKAVPIDVFVKVVAAGIAEHNARKERKTRVCGGVLSFDDAFNTSYEQSLIRKAAPEQRRLWLLAAESVRAHKRDGSIEIEGNRFWAEFMAALRGQAVVVRFDPENLRRDLHVYRADGAYLGAAACTLPAGFADVEQARLHGRARRTWLRAQADQLRAERSMSVSQLLELQGSVAAPPEPGTPETKVVRLVRGNTVQLREESLSADDRYEREVAKQSRLLEAMAAPYAGRSLRIVEEE